MRTYTFNVGGIRVRLHASPEAASLYTWCLVTAFQTLRAAGGGRRPRPAEIIQRATRLRLGMMMGMTANERRSNHVH